MINRREFLRVGGALAAVGLARPKLALVQTAGKEAGPKKAKPGLRTITYNVLACKGYPEVDANETLLARAQNQMATRIALELALYEPDIVSFQESPSEKVVASIAKQMGMRYVYFPGGWQGSLDWPGGFPGTIITRFNITESENCPLIRGQRPEKLFTRHWGRAVLQTDTEELAFFSAHLHPSKKDIRALEVTEMLAVMEKELRSGRSLLFQGDLNHKPDGPEYQRWADAGLMDMFAEKGVGQPFTIPSTTATSRIDYIWAQGPIARRLRQCRILFEGAFRTNPDDPRSFALSDHIPVMATFD